MYGLVPTIHIFTKTLSKVFRLGTVSKDLHLQGSKPKPMQGKEAPRHFAAGVLIPGVVGMVAAASLRGLAVEVTSAMRFRWWHGGAG